MEEDADVVVGHGAAALRLAAPLLGTRDSGAWGDASVGANGDAAPLSKPSDAAVHRVVFVFRSLWELALADGADVDWCVGARARGCADVDACVTCAVRAGLRAWQRLSFRTKRSGQQVPRSACSSSAHWRRSCVCAA
jgi:hypothetical protein